MLAFFLKLSRTIARCLAMIPFQSPRGQLSPLPTDGPRTSDNITDKCEGTTARDW